MTFPNKTSLRFWLFPVSLLLAFVLSSYLAAYLARLIFPAPEGLTLLAGYSLAFLFTIGWASAYRRSGAFVYLPSWHPRRWKFRPQAVLLGLLLTFAVSIVLTPLLNLPFFAGDYAELTDQMARTVNSPWGIATTLLAAPILEEYLFRGILQTTLTRRLGPLGGIAIASLLFGAIHIHPYQVLYATLLGMILGMVYWRTASLLNAVAIHFLNNAITLLLYFNSGDTPVEETLLRQPRLGPWLYAAAAACLLAGVVVSVLVVRKRSRSSR